MFNFVVTSLGSIKKYRNIILHNDIHFINKSSVSELYSFLIKEEDLLNNGFVNNLIIEIQKWIEEEINRPSKSIKEHNNKYFHWENIPSLMSNYKQFYKTTK